MKAKSLILSGLLLIGAGAATTSCEDMMTADNKLVTDDFAPNDTVYQMLGIVQAMQKVMDKTILLGEIRADLVDINTTTSTDLRELAENNISVSNAYNAPADYYNVINNCNIYLAYVDTALKTHGDYYYEKEIIAAKCFRAWSYLELAKIYGAVPFITEPVLNANAGEKIIADNTNRKDLVAICDELIPDLEKIVQTDRNRSLIPSYVNRQYFIPVRVMLAELYLYRGSFTQSTDDFKKAVINYHDFLAFPNEEIRSQARYSASWDSREWMGAWSTRYQGSTTEITVIPMDTISYYKGSNSDLREVFNAQYSNNYYAPVNPSVRLREIANAQDYTFVDAIRANEYDTIVGHPTIDELAHFDNPENYVGDLRYQSSYTNHSVNDRYHAEYSKTRQYIGKYGGYGSTDVRLNTVTLFTSDAIYLHLAEALNHAGFPETAFALLKYGISETILADSTKVSKVELEGLQALTSNGFASNAADWDENVFVTVDRNSNASRDNSTQKALHSFGSGYCWSNPSYAISNGGANLLELPEDTFFYAIVTHEDSVAYNKYLQEVARINALNAQALREPAVVSARQAEVDKYILDELALTMMYEGHRFYDLMRYAKFWNKPAFLGETISKRKGAENVDASLAGRLASEAGWYLPLPTR